MSPPEDHRRSAAATRCAPLAPRPILCPSFQRRPRVKTGARLISPKGNYPAGPSRSLTLRDAPRLWRHVG
jgi:hypothetical protein